MNSKYDIVIIGSGVGGLVAANILAKNGFKVCVLEKNNQFGGALQTFSRDKHVFDTGIHYLGGLEKGQNLYQFFKYLDIIDDLELQRMDDEKFDVISFDGIEKEFYHAQGYKNFAKSLINQFPEEKKAITDYCQKMQDICASFPLYNIEDTATYNFEILSIKTVDYLNSITDNELLKSVLLGSNLLYAGQEKTPMYVHALSVNSYIESSWRCVKGGGQIAKLLLRKLKELGGEAYKYQEVVDFGFEEEKLVSVLTKNGDTVKADRFISNIDPKTTLEILNERGFRKSYINRIKKIESIISVFSIYLVFKPETFEYLNYNHYHHKDISKVLDNQNYTPSSWPESYMLSMGERQSNSKWAVSMTGLALMNFDDVKQWENTFNVVFDKKDRGVSYERFKKEKAQAFINEIEKKFPGIKEKIQAVHVSTPLTYRDYIGNKKGSAYGYVKDADNPLLSFLLPTTKLKNLYFTGQSLNLHGVLGVTISAVLTCASILDRKQLIKDIRDA